MLAWELEPLGNCWGSRAAHLMQGQQGMDLPQVKLGETKPGDLKTGVLLCFIQKKWSCYPEGAAAEVLGCTIRVGTFQNCHRSQHRSAVGGTGTTVLLDQNHIHPQMPCGMVWFVGMVTRPNEARGFALSVCLVLVSQCQDLLQDTMTKPCLMAPPEKPGFSAFWKQSSLDSLGGRPKWFQQRANARKGMI